MYANKKKSDHIFFQEIFQSFPCKYPHSDIFQQLFLLEKKFMRDYLIRKTAGVLKRE